MPDNNELNALIHLLDDDDSEVFKHVHDKLLSLGTDIIPDLEEAWHSELNPLAHTRLENIIHQIQFNAIDHEWEEWTFGEPPSLIEGAYLVAKYHYPDLELDDILKKMMKLKQSIWLELNYNQTPLEQVQIFNQIFYGYHGFRGSQTSADYQDFCINNVLETRRGNSIIIGIIYQVLAIELNLPVYGVTLQRHFVLAFCKKNILDFFSVNNLEREVMFYINPINKGSIFSRNEIKDYLEKMHVEQDPSQFVPASNVAIVKELLRYLIEIYENQNREDRVGELKKLLGYI